MRTPWFMHSHLGVNTLVGVYPVPQGVYVRSFDHGWCEVTFYPRVGRTVTGIGKFQSAQYWGPKARFDGNAFETAIDEAVEAHLKNLG